jgi:NO-binding membrane sensor protein with MHYT domain/GAF domain-containing protein/HAMP domain-containing protein
MPPNTSTPYLSHGHDPWLVALSVAMAILAAYAALEMVWRTFGARGRERYLWLAGSAVTLGAGIWSMHFIGMMAFQLPVPVQYNVLTALASLLPAVAGAALAFWLIGQAELRPWQIGLAGLVLGGAIAGTYFTGMAALRLRAVFGYDPAWTAIALVIAVAGSSIALWLHAGSRADVTPNVSLEKIAGALVLGGGIAGLHYAGMRAAVFLPTSAYPLDPAGSVGINVLGTAAVIVGALTVITAGLTFSVLDQQLGRLSFTRKFLLISALFITPLVVIISLFSLELYDRIDKYGNRELYGVRYLAPLQSLLSNLQAHQEALMEYAAGRMTQQQLSEIRSAIDADLAAAAELDSRYGAQLQTSAQLASLTFKWSGLRGQLLEFSPMAARLRHAQLAADVRELIAHVGDTSFLILDPDLDSYYLMEAVLIRLPDNQMLLNQSAQALLAALNGEQITPGEKARLVAALTLLRANLSALETKLEVAYRNDPAGFIEPNVAPAFAAYYQTLTEYMDFVNLQLVQLAEPTASIVDARRVIGEARAANNRFYSVVSDNLAASIQGRIDRLTSRLAVLTGFSLFASALALAFGLAVFRAIIRPLRALTDAAQALAGGNLGARVNVVGSDEIATLALTFNDMARRLQLSQAELAERNRALAASAEVSRRLSTVLDEAQLVREVVEQIQKAFGYYHAHIYLFDDRRENLMMAGGTGPAGAALLARGHKLPRGKGLVGRAAETNAPVFVPHTAQDPDWLPNPLLPETQAEIAVPLTVGGEVLGVLDVQHSVAGGLHLSDVETLQSIGNQVAVALRNARSYARAQRAAEREALVNNINRKIQSAVSLEAVLDIAARELGQALRARAATAELNLRPAPERSPALAAAGGRTPSVHADHERAGTNGHSHS